MSGICVISNRNARKNKKNPEGLKLLEGLLTDDDLFIATTSLSEVYIAAEKCKKKNIDILCLNGGDGTNHCTLSIFIKVYKETPLPKIALLRGGTLNTVAQSCGVYGAPLDLLGSIVYKFYNKQQFIVIQRTLMEINEEYGFLFGNGILVNFLKVYYESSNDPSPMHAVSTLIKVTGSAIIGGPLIDKVFEQVKMKVYADGELWSETSWDAIAAGTIPDIGLNFKPFFKSLENPGKIHVLGVHCGAVRTALQLYNMLRSKQMTDPKIIDGVATHIKMISEKPFSYQLDGDIKSSNGILEIKSGPTVSIIQS